jgi:hypothetical protein
MFSRGRVRRKMCDGLAIHKWVLNRYENLLLYLLYLLYPSFQRLTGQSI